MGSERGAELRGPEIEGAGLRGPGLKGAGLEKDGHEGARLRGTGQRGARIGGAVPNVINVPRFIRRNVINTGDRVYDDFTVRVWPNLCVNQTFTKNQSLPLRRSQLAIVIKC